MGAKAPPAPDYAAANVAGAQANAQVLPLQIGVDRSARAGNIYTDPDTGKTYDFTGMGDAELNALDAANTERLMKSGADIQRDLTKGQYQDLVDLLPKYNDLNLQAQRGAYEASLEASKAGTANTYNQNLEYMPKFGELQRSENEKAYNQNLDLSEQGTRRQTDLQKELLPELNDLQRSQDALGYRQNLDLGEEGSRRNLDLQNELLPQLNNLLRGEEAKGYQQNLDLAGQGARSYANLQKELMPQLNQTGLDAQLQSARASRQAEAELNPERDALRRGAGKVLLEELQSNGLTDLQKQDMEQQMRMSQSSRGNILGAGAGFDEARQIERAGEESRQGRRQLALQFLGTPDLAQQFSTAGAAPAAMPTPNSVNSPGMATAMPDYRSTATVNPLMPNYGATTMLNPQNPSFAATTTGGPNLNPVNINQSQGFSYVDKDAGTKGASFATDIWKEQARQAEAKNSATMGLIGGGLSAASMFM